MGRPRGGAVSSSSEAASKVDDKSKGIVRTSTRERKELMPSYNEESERSEESEMSEGDEVVSDYKGSLSESVSEAESSGSEYGKKKSTKGKIITKKTTAKGGRGRKSTSVSPKKAGRKPAAKKASPAKGKGPKAAAKKPAAAPTRSRPQRGQATKRLKYRERGSDSEDEESIELSDDSDVEEVDQETDESPPEQMSDSEKESKSRKRKAPAVTPKGRAAKGRKSESAENGNGKKKDVDEDEEEDEEDEDLKEEKEEKDGNGKAETSNGKGKEKEKKKAEEDKAEKMEEDEEEEIEETDKKIVEKKEKEVAETKEKAKGKKNEEEEEDEEDEEDNESLKGSVASKDGEPKNPTVTDYSTIKFECDKKTKAGDAWNLKISCWNIGGIRSWVKKNGLEYLDKEDPDVMCLQEIKATEKNMPPEMGKLEKYPHVYWSYSETGAHHGVGILAKTKPIKVSYGLPPKDDDTEAVKKLKEQFTLDGRIVVAEFEKYILVNAYVPNSGQPVKDNSRPKPYPTKIINGERIEFDRLFREYVKELDTEKPVIVTGDLNCAHEEIDLANPKTNHCTAGFTKEEREDFTKLLEEAKLIDSFRALYPDEKAVYSFWSYRRDARAKNVGWRLDYFLLSSKLKDSLVENTMRSKVLGSDHCPIVLFMHI